jgi:outer membrane lipoprotein-sorting protein
MSNVITTKNFKLIIVLAFVTLALFVSGCTEKNLSAEEIAAQIMDKQNSIQDYSYTLHTTSDLVEKTVESEDKFMIKKPNMFKEIIIEPGTGNQTIIVFDGEFMWNYHPDTNEVVKTKLSGNPLPTQNDYLNMIGEIMNSTNVTLLGMENIDGRTAYLLETTEKETNVSSLLPDRTKIWIDKETWIPLKIEIYFEGKLFQRFEFRDLKINSGIPDSEFKFEIPKGAKVVEEKLPEILSLEDARKKATFKILTPKYLPEGYSFNSSMMFNNSNDISSNEIFETVDLTYMKDKDTIGLTETVYENMSSINKDFLSDGKDIKINGIEGKYVSIEDMKILRWKLGNVQLSLSAPLKKDEMLKIAESISEKA